MTTRIDIINRALVRIGEEPLQSEEAPGADTHLAVYDSILEMLLSLYPWSFARAVWRLARLSTAPAQHWAYAYQLPTDLLGAPRAAFNRSDRRLPFTDWRLEGRTLLTDAEEVWLEGMRKPVPVYWPGYFRELVTKAIMSELALSVMQDKAIHTALREQVYGSEAMMGEGGLLGQAKAQDAQGQPSAVVAEGSNPLIDVRY